MRVSNSTCSSWSCISAIIIPVLLLRHVDGIRTQSIVGSVPTFNERPVSERETLEAMANSRNAASLLLLMFRPPYASNLPRADQLPHAKSHTRSLHHHRIKLARRLGVRRADVPQMAGPTLDDLLEASQNILQPFKELLRSSYYPEVSSEQILRPLFDGQIDPDAVAAACNEGVVWDDMSKQAPLVGPDAVRDHLRSKFPEGSILKIDRISDGVRSGGFTWHREADGLVGLRGTLFAELDSEGKLLYVREGCEPLFKPGEATEKLLKAITSNIEKPERVSSFIPKQPKTANGVVKYLWEEAYPGGASPEVALGLFADDIVYEDFNYPTPFMGLSEVTDFVTAFDIPGIEFVPMKISEGKRGCAFTWKVKVNGQDGPSGISFYEVNDEGKVTYIRDIPAPSMPFGLPPPLATLAAIFQPKLRTFQARP